MAAKCGSESGRPKCPFCDEEIAEMAFPYCESCQVMLDSCPHCGGAMRSAATVCPQCGKTVESGAGTEG